jgi:hypothetical protein
VRLRADLFERWPEANALLIYDGQAPSQIFNKPWFSKEPIQYCDYFSSGGVVRNAQYDNAAVFLRRIVTDISEIQVPREQRFTSLTDAPRDLSVRSGPQPDIAREPSLMTASGERADCRSRQIGIDQQTHRRSGGGQRVKRLLFRQFSYEQERCSDIVGGQVIFPLDFLERHPARQAAHDHRYRQPSAPDHGFAMSDRRIEDDAVQGSHI